MALVKRRPEEIIGEWGIRDVTPPSQRERRQLEAESELNPLVGRPLRRRVRNFRSEADNYLAALGGPLPYMRRLREIEAETDRHLRQLEEAYADHRGDPARWRDVAERWDFTDVNELIARHNRWYPVEARLSMDPRTRDFVNVGGRPYRREPLDAHWILERFPPT
jgi:hypothetical protein